MTQKGEAYRARTLLWAIELRARELDQRARTVREESAERAAKVEVDLSNLQASVDSLLPLHVEDRKRWNASTRRGRPIRFSPEGLRILDYFDDYSLTRAQLRVAYATSLLEADRISADALIGVALHLEEAARKLREDVDRNREAVERLRIAEQDAKARYDEVKAELEAAGGPLNS